MYSRPEGTYGVFQPERVHSCVSQDSDLEAMIKHMEDALNGDSVGECVCVCVCVYMCICVYI